MTNQSKQERLFDIVQLAKQIFTSHIADKPYPYTLGDETSADDFKRNAQKAMQRAIQGSFKAAELFIEEQEEYAKRNKV